MQLEFIFDYLLAHCTAPATLKTTTSEALVKILESRAVEAGVPGNFPDTLTELDNQHGLMVTVARAIAQGKALHIQQLLLKKTSVKKIKFL